MVAPPIPSRVEFTGRCRARPGWFGRQILQVEECWQPYRWCSPRPDQPETAHRMIDCGVATLRWRDARWQDVQDLGPLEASRVARSCNYEKPNP